MPARSEAEYRAAGGPNDVEGDEPQHWPLLLDSPEFHEIDGEHYCIVTRAGAFEANLVRGILRHVPAPASRPSVRWMVHGAALVVCTSRAPERYWIGFRSFTFHRQLGALLVYAEHHDLAERVQRVSMRAHDLGDTDFMGFARGHRSFEQGLTEALNIVDHALRDQAPRNRSLGAWALQALFDHAFHRCYGTFGMKELADRAKGLGRRARRERDGEVRRAMLDAEHASVKAGRYLRGEPDPDE